MQEAVERYYVRAYTERGGFHSNGCFFPTLESARDAAKSYLGRNDSLVGCSIIRDRQEVGRVVRGEA